jgi:hypothetical protein
MSQATSTHGGRCMKRVRHHYDRKFKISVVAELKVANRLLRSLASMAFIRACPLGGEKS